MKFKKILHTSLFAVGAGLAVSTCGSAITIGRGIHAESKSEQFCKNLGNEIQNLKVDPICLYDKVAEDGKGDFGIDIKGQLTSDIKNNNFNSAATQIYKIALGNRNNRASIYEKGLFELYKLWISAVPGNENFWSELLLFAADTQKQILNQMKECEVKDKKRINFTQIL